MTSKLSLYSRYGLPLPYVELHEYASKRILGPDPHGSTVYWQMKERIPSFEWSGSGGATTFAVLDLGTKLKFEHWRYIANTKTGAYSLRFRATLVTPTLRAQYEHSFAKDCPIAFQVRETGRERCRTFSKDFRHRLPLGYKTTLRNAEIFTLEYLYSGHLLEWMVDQFIQGGGIPTLK